MLLRRGLSPAPKTIAQLARLRLCTQISTTATDLTTGRIHPLKPARLFGNSTLLLDALSAGTCDAVVYDAPILATLRAQVRTRSGDLVGVIATGEQYGVLLPQGSAPISASCPSSLSMEVENTVSCTTAPDVAERTSASGSNSYLAFVPWILFSVIAPRDTLAAASIVALVAALAICLRTVGHGRPKVIELGAVVAFAGFTVAAFVLDAAASDDVVRSARRSPPA